MNKQDPIQQEPRSTRLSWLGLLASVTGLAAAFVCSFEPPDPVLWIGVAVVPLGYVGFFVSVLTLHRTPVRSAIGLIIGALASVAASDIYSALLTN